MAFTNVSVPVNGAPVSPPVAYGAAALTQVTPFTGSPKFLDITAGATATTVVVVRPGTHPDGTPKADYSVAITSARRLIPLNDPDFVDASRNITITVSQITAVTGAVLEFTP